MTETALYWAVSFSVAAKRTWLPLLGVLPRRSSPRRPAGGGLPARLPSLPLGAGRRSGSFVAGIAGKYLYRAARGGRRYKSSSLPVKQLWPPIAGRPLFFLRRRGLEPPCLSAPAPQAGVSTSSTIAARNVAVISQPPRESQAPGLPGHPGSSSVRLGGSRDPLRARPGTRALPAAFPRFFEVGQNFSRPRQGVVHIVQNVRLPDLLQ